MDPKTSRISLAGRTDTRARARLGARRGRGRGCGADSLHELDRGAAQQTEQSSATDALGPPLGAVMGVPRGAVAVAGCCRKTEDGRRRRGR